MNLRRKLAILLAGMVASVLVLVAIRSPASATEPNTASYRPLINYGSGKCLEPVGPNGHTEINGIPVQQRSCQLTRVQNWAFVSLGAIPFNGQPPWYCPWCDPLGAIGYHIVNLQTGQCLDARDGATSDGSVVQQWPCQDHTARSMLWWVETGEYPGGGLGTFKVVNFRSELCLDVRSGSHDDGAQIQQYHCTSNNPAQNFFQ